ncbi:hypothetical protein [uncultured Acetatifactor sp.]|uniref:hypothetical protein n=1 Tax=uncultured Acetatifactor sp. TaxID=1671927 RepID=UPI0026030BF3|nr:hypothetical protein [uncultured Acetatifactor sp.]
MRPAAAICRHFLMTGYPENGVYYEIYGENTYIQRSGNGLYITREVVYSGSSAPPLEIQWQERINNLTYTGTLYIKTSLMTQKATEPPLPTRESSPQNSRSIHSPVQPLKVPGL